MNTTTAIQLIKNGAAEEAFRLTEITLPDLSPHEVRIEVSHFGLNYADVMARLGLYKECPPLPTVLGYEVVGKVTKVGSQTHTHLLHQKVVAFTRFGGYAKQVNTFAHAVAPIGDLVPDKALSLATQYVTAYYMTHCLTVIQPGETALVHAAAGGVGIALLQLLKNLNVRCIAKVGNDKKAQWIKSLGVKDVIDYSTSDYTQQLKRLLGDAPLTLSFNPFGGKTFKQDMRLLSPHGRLLLFGGSERSGKKWGIFSTLNFLRNMGLIIQIGLMMGSKSVLGVNMLHIADKHPLLLQKCLQAVVKLANNHEIDPVVGATFKAEELYKAHNFLGSGKSIGKIVVEW